MQDEISRGPHLMKHKNFNRSQIKVSRGWLNAKHFVKFYQMMFIIHCYVLLGVVKRLCCIWNTCPINKHDTAQKNPMKWFSYSLLVSKTHYKLTSSNNLSYPSLVIWIYIFGWASLIYIALWWGRKEKIAHFLFLKYLE